MNAQRLLDSFLEMVRIESPSWHEAPMARYCLGQLINLGFEVTFDDSAAQTGSDTGNLIAVLPGTAQGKVAFCAHMDTVVPCTGIEPVIVEEAFADGGLAAAEAGGKAAAGRTVIRSAGNTILSADDKAGIAAIFEGVRSVLERDEPRPDIVVVLTVCEEQSLLGSSALQTDVLEGGVPCFVLDADGAAGTVIVGAPCHYTVRAEFAGRPAHAGVEPELGLSAIAMAASAVSAMTLGRLDECTTANIGVIRGGAATNIVPETCRVEGECRSLYEDRALAQRNAMDEALREAARSMGGSVDIQWTLDYPAILYGEDDPLVQSVLDAAREAGLEPHCRITGGGADANVLGFKGARAITLATGMTNFHTEDEFIAVEDLEGCARLVEALIARYAGARQ